MKIIKITDVYGNHFWINTDNILMISSTFNKFERGDQKGWSTAITSTENKIIELAITVDDFWEQYNEQSE